MWADSISHVIVDFPASVTESRLSVQQNYSELSIIFNPPQQKLSFLIALCMFKYIAQGTSQKTSK